MAHGWSSVEDPGFIHQCQNCLEGEEEILEFSEWPRALYWAVVRKAQVNRRKEKGRYFTAPRGLLSWPQGRESKMWCFWQVVDNRTGFLCKLNWSLMMKVAINAGYAAQKTSLQSSETHQLAQVVSGTSFVTTHSLFSHSSAQWATITQTVLPGLSSMYITCPWEEANPLSWDYWALLLNKGPQINSFVATARPLQKAVWCSNERCGMVLHKSF